MNDQLQKALAGNIELFTQWLKDSVNATGDFITRETPLFIQEYLTWCFWEAALRGILSLLLVFVLFGIWLWVWKSTKKLVDLSDEAGFVGRIVATVICGGLISSLLICGVYQNGMTALKIRVAPRLVLVEKAAELVKDLTGTGETPHGRR